MATEQVIDPDGRAVVFDAGSHLHLAEGGRGWLLDHIDEILIAVQRPDCHAGQLSADELAPVLQTAA